MGLDFKSIKIVRYLLSLSMALTPTWGAMAKSKATQDEVSILLAQATIMFKKHKTYESLIDEVFGGPEVKKEDLNWLKSHYKELLPKPVPAMAVDQYKVTLTSPDGKETLVVEMVDPFKGVYKIGDYEAQIDFENKGVKGSIQYMERILRKIESQKKSAAHEMMNLLIPEAHGLGLYLAAFAVGVAALFYFVDKGVNGAYDDVKDAFGDHDVTEAQIRCSNPGGPAREACQADAVLIPRPYELILVRNKKTERYYLCPTSTSASEMRGTMYRFADDDGDGKGEKIHFSDSANMTADSEHQLSGDEIKSIKAVTAAVAACCERKGQDCATKLNSKFKLRGDTRQRSDNLSKSAQ